MANIHIKELFGSDNITDLTEKVNFNFDQLILAGGGPEGPIGPSGGSGSAGPAGPRGSQWVAGFGATTINLPTDGVYRKNDFLLDDGGSFVGGVTGQVFYYNSTAWVDTGINLRGPKGDIGGPGDGAISIMPGEPQPIPSSVNAFVPNYTDLSTAALQPSIQTFITSLATSTDADDYASSGSFINGGVDFIGIGRGNNSLVLGRYATLFPTGAAGARFQPPISASGDANDVMKLFPTEESDVPMLYVSQNDYKDPTNINNTYKNGISIGLTISNSNDKYTTSGDPSSQRMNYANNANISIENKFHDLKITSSNMLTLSAKLGSSLFRLGNTGTRTGQTVLDRSTKLFSEQYTDFHLEKSFYINLPNEGNYDTTSSGEIISQSWGTLSENYAKAWSDRNDDYRGESSRSMLVGEGTDNNSNELVFSLDSLVGTNTTTKEKYIATKRTASPSSSLQTALDFDSNYKGFLFKFGQTVVNPGKMTSGTTGLPSVTANYRINLNYQGFGYDQSFIQYSGIDNSPKNTVPGSGSFINDGTKKSFDAILPNDTTLENALGYNIKTPLTNQEGSRSMTRMGIYPGFFRKEKDTSSTYVGTADERQKKFFDVAHRMMPTGSLDVFGTVRIREQETTDAGAKDGWLVVNKKDGILGFQDPNGVGGNLGTPTFSIIMFPEMASNKFSFYTASRRTFASGYPSGNQAYDFKAGSTSSPFSAFPGKGSDELKDYYICNGAVLADSRDCIATGPFSKMKGMNIDANNGTQRVVNNQFLSTTSGTDFDYEVNNDFVSPDGAVNNNSPNLFITSKSKTYAQLLVDIMNGNEPVNVGAGGGNVEFNRMFTWGSAFNWGESILAPNGIESGFRVVLPNYFGRVAKMQFPNSTSIVRAITGNNGFSEDFSATPISPGSKVTAGYIYHVADSTYNQTWMMKSMFDSGGFPYINGLQMPRNIIKTDAVGSHDHESGSYNIEEPSAGATGDKEAGAHFHSIRGQVEGNGTPGSFLRRTGGNNDGNHANINDQEQKLATFLTGGERTINILQSFGQNNSSFGNEGGHGHETSYFSGNSGFAGEVPAKVYSLKSWIDGNGRNYREDDSEIVNFRDTGFKISKYFAYDDSDNSGDYSKFSNWINYTPASTFAGPQSGQKFISPPFKGTIMAINLKGITNPNRLGDDGKPSVITDLHFVGGVPKCGIFSDGSPSGVEKDMSWYSSISRKSDGTVYAHGCATTYLDSIFTKLTNLNSIYDDIKGATNGTTLFGRPHMNAFEYGYKEMSRNDDTMHPETWVVGERNEFTSTLDYNAKNTTDTDKKIKDLYHTHLTRRDDFNT